MAPPSRKPLLGEEVLPGLFLLLRMRDEEEAVRVLSKLRVDGHARLDAELGIALRLRRQMRYS